MIEKVFVDSNVLETPDAGSGDKQRIAVTGHAGEQSSSKIVHNALADGFRLRQSFSCPDQPQLHGLGRWPTYMLDMLTETPVLADRATKNVLTLLTGYLQ